MIKHTFKVKKTKHDDAHEFTVEMPSTLDDTDAIVARYGSVERMIDRANSQWTVDVAVGVRKRLPNVDAAQAYADGYCDNGSKDTFVPKVDPAAAAAAGVEFDEEQLAYLKERGLLAS